MAESSVKLNEERPLKGQSCLILTEIKYTSSRCEEEKKNNYLIIQEHFRENISIFLNFHRHEYFNCEKIMEFVSW